MYSVYSEVLVRSGIYRLYKQSKLGTLLVYQQWVTVTMVTGVTLHRPNRDIGETYFIEDVCF